jgi:zinc protease
MRSVRLDARAPRLAAVLLVAAGLACARRGSESPSGAPNSAVLLPVADDPTVSFKIWFQVGSQADPKGKEGLAYLTGHLLAEGSTTQNPYEAILAKLYPLASSYQVRVDREMTTFGGRTHRDNLEKFNELLTDALLHPAFDSADFERVRSDALNEIEKNLRYASDEELGKAAFMEMVFAGTPYQHPEVGTAQGLKTITLDDVKSFYLSHYTRGNLVVGLGGGYPADLPTRLASALQALPAGAPAQIPAPLPAPVHGRQALLVSKPGANASISFGFPIDVHRGQRDFYALWLANSWLGEHRNSSSHLYQVIRSDRGLNYGDYSYIEAYPEGGQRNKPPTNVGRRQQCFEVWIRTLPNEQAVFALRAALHEVQDLVEHGMTAEEFELTRSFLDKYVLHFAETTTDRLGYAIDDRYYGIEGSHLQDFRRILHELTLEEVNTAIRKHLQVENMKIAIVTGEAEKLQQQLTADAPTPIQYKSKMPDAVAQEDVTIASVPLKVDAAAVQVVPVDKMFEN